MALIQILDTLLYRCIGSLEFPIFSGRIRTRIRRVQFDGKIEWETTLEDSNIYTKVIR
jgi:hypothetical protein